MFNVDIEFKPNQKDLQATANSFPESLSRIMEKASKNSDRKMLLLIYDDINGLAENPSFAHWIKSTVDRTATSRIKAPVCLVFVGLEVRLDAMIQNNPSVNRVFRPMINIMPWKEEESYQFFKKSFRKQSVTIEKKHIKMLNNFHGGLPVIAHELGDAVWKETKTKEIQEEDIFNGIVEAARSVGARYINKEIVQALQSKTYRSILKKISESNLKSDFSKKELLSLFTLTPAEKSGVNNFLQRMRRIKGLVPVQDGIRGEYRFPTSIHRMYFRMISKQLAKK